MTDGERLYHVPALLKETIDMLRPRGGELYLDGTVGGGGHAAAILEAAQPDGRLIGLDRDPAAIEAARRRLSRYGDRVELHQASFAEIAQLPELADVRLDGALLDLGVSSHQIDDWARGFSYQQDAPLDMRMGPRGEPARDWVSRADFSDLAEAIARYGEERHARRIARAIVRERERSPIETTGRLRSLVESAVPASGHPLKSVARVFQALRIVVNDELAALDAGLRQCVDRLKDRARFVVIAYHSLEDRIVKHTFRELASDCVCPPGLPICRCGKVVEAVVLTRRAVRPGTLEVTANPRARSARLRAIERRVEGGSR